MSLEISGLSFGYRRDLLFDALDAANLERGKLVALVGPNGVGKSSLFRLIAGYNAMRGGCISLDGQDLAGIAPRHRAERIFLLGQQVSIRAALGVFDVVLLARKGGRGGRAGRGDLAAVEDVLETLGLEVMHLIRKVTRQRNLVTIAALHDLALASRFADRFLLLHHGRIAADGDPETVLSSPYAEEAYGVGIRLERTSRGDLVVDPHLRLA
jgi:iron complex transport system ATP-binding protein